MKIKRMISPIALAAAVIVAIAPGCSDHNRRTIGSGEIHTEIVRLDSLIYNSSSVDSFAGPLAQLAYLMTGSDSLSVSDYAKQASQSPAYRVFGADISSRIDPEGLRRQAVAYASARNAAISLLPELDMPDTLFTVVSPFRQSVMLAGKRCYVALNHFLGSDYPGYKQFPEQMRRQKSLDLFAASTVEALIRSNYDLDGDAAAIQPTVAARMFHEGAVFYAVSKLLPDVSPARIMGFTDEELKWLSSNEAAVWHEIVGRDLLFSTRSADAGRLLESLASYTGDTSPMPSRAGRYIGYRMAVRMMEREPSVSLGELLSLSTSTDPNLLRRIEYTPR